MPSFEDNAPAPQRVAADHPALAGHFPGHPVVPGVVLLDRVARHAEAHHPGAGPVSGFATVKFLAPLGPETEYRIELVPAEDGSGFRFAVRTEAALIAQGTGRW